MLLRSNEKEATVRVYRKAQLRYGTAVSSTSSQLCPVASGKSKRTLSTEPAASSSAELNFGAGVRGTAESFAVTSAHAAIALGPSWRREKGRPFCKALFGLPSLKSWSTLVSKSVARAAAIRSFTIFACVDEALKLSPLAKSW
jgi:hypothetical protein